MKSLSTVIAYVGNRTRDRPDAAGDNVHVFLKKKFNMYYISRFSLYRSVSTCSLSHQTIPFVQYWERIAGRSEIHKKIVNCINRNYIS